MQKVLKMTTRGCYMRSEANGWSYEDGDFVRVGFNNFCEMESLNSVSFNHNNFPIGYVKSNNVNYRYATPLHAIGDGWKLLNQPSYIKNYDNYDWWFTKD